MHVRPIQPGDLAFIREELVRHWGDTGIWSIGRRYQADELPGFVAVEPAGEAKTASEGLRQSDEPSASDSPRGGASDSADGGISETFLGLVTYSIFEGNYQAEVVTLSSRRENTGVGAALLDAAVNAIREAGCVRAFLCTTNDNIRAIRFYQKRGWSLAKLHKNAVAEARARFPHIPRIGMHGIEIRDELEFERWLR